jgi:hypothetical protein
MPAWWQFQLLSDIAKRRRSAAKPVGRIADRSGSRPDLPDFSVPFLFGKRIPDSANFRFGSAWLQRNGSGRVRY